MQVPLQEFAGLVASMRPSELPDGASPRNNDVDYLTARVMQRPGCQNVYAYQGQSQGPNPAFSAVDTPEGGVPWTNPANILLDDGSYATCAPVTSGSESSSTSTGTSAGGGSPWSNPGNIDSVSAFASVNLSSSGGGTYNPSTTTGTASATATPSNPSVSQTTPLGSFASVAASAATIYVTLSGTVVVAGSGSATLTLQYSTDSGATWQTRSTWNTSFSSSTIPITLTGLANLDTVLIQLVAQAECYSGPHTSAFLTVSNWYAQTGGSGSPSSQTLSAAISGLAVPTGATIVGLEVSAQADYSGTSPSFSISLNVGSEVDTPALTTSPATYTAGGSSDLWGYAGWSNATLAALTADFIASSGGSSTVNVNSLVVTVYYTLPATVSDFLDVTNFTFSIPSNQAPTGVAVSLKGYSSAGQTAWVELLANGVALGPPKSFTLPSSNQTTVLGGATDPWGASLSAAILNASNFGVRIWVEGTGTAYLDYIETEVYLTAATANFNYVGGFTSSTGIVYNLALDAQGDWYLENVTNSPGVLTQVLSGTTAGSYGSGATVYDRAFVANSNLSGSLITGNDIPRQYNFEQNWWDRVTQAGPGAPPAFAATTSAGSLLTITAYAVASNIVTLTYTGTQPTAGEVGTFSGLSVATFLNGQTLIVLGTGLTSTEFQVAFVTGNVSTTSDSGLFTPQYSYAITSITQPAAQSDPSDSGHLSVMLWSAGPGSTSSGNVLTVYYKSSWPPGTSPDETLVQAFNAGYPVYVYLTNCPFGNGIWQVTSIGNALPPEVDHYRWYFTVQLPTSSYQIEIEPTGEYQITQGTVTTAVPVPGLAPGAQVSLAGNSVTAWDGTYPVVEALNSGAFNITQTALSGGTATYTWALVSGVAPAAGQLVTITNTLNANGILNVTDAVIATATGTSSGTFTIAGFPGNQTFSTTPEEGQATTAGTQFIIDPGAANEGSTTVNPIYGNSTGGTLTIVGSASSGTLPIGAGTRQGVCYFITRNGGGYAASPPVTFTVAEDANYITASNIPIGPPNVVARAIALTEAGQNGVAGANFYTSTVPTIFTVGSVQYTSSSFLIPDNVTTTAQFTFSDAVLLQSEAIDVTGSDYFNLIEIGNPAAILQYADRTFYIGCQNKVQNFNNLSFDGGYLAPNGSAPALPLGWSIDGPSNPAYGTAFTITAFSIASNIVTLVCANTLSPGLDVEVDGLSTGTYLNGQTLNVLTATSSEITAAFTYTNVSLTTDSGTVASVVTSIALRISPVFGNSLYVKNSTASTQATFGMIAQSAYQDAWNEPILNPDGIPVPYSLRVTVRSPSGATSGSIVFDLTESNQGVYGNTLASSSLALNGLTTQMQTVTIPLTGAAGLATIPSGLLLRVWGETLPANADYEIDRVEIFPTNEPVLSNTVLVSYAEQPEAVDGVTGQITLASQSQDQIMGATILHDTLRFKKSNSSIEVEDAPNYEPSEWTTREISQRIGTCGPNAFDYGDEWNLTLHETGVYVDSGGPPMPFREMQGFPQGASLWDAINWKAKQVFWLSNNLKTRRFYIGVAMNTPNFWLPNAPAVSNPTSPNVILMCNYEGVPSVSELEGGAPVHTTMFGQVKALDMRRKWSIWQIACPYAATVTDGLYSDPGTFLCNGIASGKIYRLVSSDRQMTDDGVPIAPLYTTYGFVGMLEGQQKQVGSAQKLATKGMANVEGSGTLRIRHYPNTLEATYPWTAPYIPPLAVPMQNNIEWNIEQRFQRLYTEFSMNLSGTAAAGYFELGEMLLEIDSHAWGAYRGVSQ